MSNIIPIIIVVLGFCDLSLCIVPLYGLDSPSRVDGEYILLLRQGAQGRLVALEVLATKSDNLTVKHVYSFPNFLAVHIYATDQVIDDLRYYDTNEDIQAIEANQWTSIHGNDETEWEAEKETGSCIKQETGSQSWGLSRISYQDRPSYDAASYSYNENDGEDVYAYVIDTGVYVEHNDFEGRALRGMVAKSVADEGHRDYDGHGTHVAGTVAAKTYGVAKKATIIAAKVFHQNGSSTNTMTLEGLVWACNDFNSKMLATKRKAFGVVNMSLGGAISVALDVAISICSDTLGLTIVTAAGNDNQDACNESPARAGTGITVGATTRNDDLTSFSNYGPCVDIFAPGEDILSAGNSGLDASKVMSGTSMAAPHVTGVIARYLGGLNDPPTPQMVKAWLLDASSKNKINLTVPDSNPHISSPNRILYMGCSHVPGSGTDMAEAAVIISSVTLALVVILSVGLALSLLRGYAK